VGHDRATDTPWHPISFSGTADWRRAAPDSGSILCPPLADDPCFRHLGDALEH
jgi:hypothetical protein